VRGRPSATGEQLSFGSADGYVYTLQQNSGKKQWSVRTGAAVQSVTIVDDHVVAASLDNFAYGFTLAKGNRLWKRQLEGRPLAEPVTNGHSVLFSPIAGSGGIVLDSRDGKVLNSLPTGQDNNSAASPVITKGIVLITTRQGLLAFSHPGQ
jgi:outer membrane protein assembly factor BamB